MAPKASIRSITMIRTKGEEKGWFVRAPKRTHKQTVHFRGQFREVEVLDFLDSASQHYTSSFGVQWGKYRNVQIDRLNGTHATYNHLKMFSLNRLDALEGKRILEIGSGAGRFTDHLVDIGANVITVDSSAIFFNAALGAPNLVPVRADLFDVPVNRKQIDVVFCRGVVQHTADVRMAIRRLFEYVKPGGLVMFDVYQLKWYTPFITKYWLRPFTRNISVERFIPFAEKWVPRLLRFKNSFIKPLLPENRLGKNLGHQIVPIADFTDVPGLSRQAQVEWSVLDTVDMYTPRYDTPMTWKGVLNLLHDIGATNIKGDRGSFCFMANAPE